jgi:hypothetical protein
VEKNESGENFFFSHYSSANGLGGRVNKDVGLIEIIFVCLATLENA